MLFRLVFDVTTELSISLIDLLRSTFTLTNLVPSCCSRSLDWKSTSFSPSLWHAVILREVNVSQDLMPRCLQILFTIRSDEGSIEEFFFISATEFRRENEFRVTSALIEFREKKLCPEDPLHLRRVLSLSLSSDSKAPVLEVEVWQSTFCSRILSTCSSSSFSPACCYSRLL